jgi:peptide/nickel transport system ATP-binding protein
VEGFIQTFSVLSSQDELILCVIATCHKAGINFIKEAMVLYLMVDDRLLSVENLSVEYAAQEGVVRALEDVSLQVSPKEFVAIVGESGSGKSTLALAIIGLLPPNAKLHGKIIYKGRNLIELAKKEMINIRGTEIGMVFQEPLSSLNPVEKVGDQMVEALRIAKNRRGSLSRVFNYSAGAKDVLTATGVSGTGMLSLFPKFRRNAPMDLILEAREWLEKVRIPDPERILQRYPFELSGGMMQRVMIAMALSQSPSLLLADEPTTALDVTTQAQILKLMRILKDSVGAALILITHDLGVAAQVADRVVVLYAGEVVEDAPVKELFSNPMHPYTRSLLRCLPRQTKADGELEVIRGTIPDLRNKIVGCKFADRCDHANKKCTEERPRLVDIGGNHYVRCTLYY